MANGQSTGAAGKTTVGQQGTGLAETLGFQIAGRVEHFLHARSALGSFIADNHDIAG